MAIFEDQVIALAGTLQAAQVVDDISKHGRYNNPEFEPLLNSLFEFEPDSTAAVFGGVPGVKPGLKQLLELLDGNNLEKHRDLIRYFFSLLHLERKLSSKPELLGIIHTRLQHAALKREHFTDQHSDTCHSLSGIYQDTISTLSYRIHVTGSMQHLQNKNNADSIRAALFAGVRAAVLWRQCGGQRRKLLFQRKRILSTASALLAAAETTDRNLH